MPKGRGSGLEELPHNRGKEQWLWFAGAAMERPHVQGNRNPSKTIRTERGDHNKDLTQTAGLPERPRVLCAASSNFSLALLPTHDV